jgi:DNA polymerase-3 subunit beta
MTATDLEVELRTHASANCEGESDFTIPARKLLDITKALPEGAIIKFDVEADKVKLRSGRSRFSLGVLPAQDYPIIEPTPSNMVFTINEAVLKRLIDKTQFAMAQQDVRYYLNGMLLEIKSGQLRTVATDGHRLALSQFNASIDTDIDTQVILPRKAVIELGRLLNDKDDEIKVELNNNYIKVLLEGAIFTSKLIDGKFPEYQR